MNVKEWLDIVAERKTLPVNHPDNISFEDDRKEYDIYVSKFDGSYITLACFVDRDDVDGLIKILAEHEVTEELTHGVGFSPKENKWYGWSHRTICGFTVGSTCKKGDCHYEPANKEDFIEATLNFWKDNDYRTNIRAEECETDGVSGIRVVWEYNDNTPNTFIRSKIATGFFTPFPEKFGKGEWVAKTLEDAKQMAIDFNEGVS